MTLWALLMAICFVTAIYCGWNAGEPAGGAGIVIGLLVGLLLGVFGVMSMFFAEVRFNRWIEAKHGHGVIQTLLYLLMLILGLLWYVPVAMAVVFITRILTHAFLTQH